MALFLATTDAVRISHRPYPMGETLMVDCIDNCFHDPTHYIKRVNRYTVGIHVGGRVVYAHANCVPTPVWQALRPSWPEGEFFLMAPVNPPSTE